MQDRNAPPGMLPPWMWYGGMPPYYQDGGRQQMPEIIVPARIDKALEFISMMTQRTMDRAVVNDIEIQIIDGQDLTDEQGVAMATACNLLTKYFGGVLPPDVWENLKVDATKRQIETEGKTGTVLNCIACHPGVANPACPLCHGSGRLFVMSVGPDNQDGRRHDKPQPKSDAE